MAMVQKKIFRGVQLLQKFQNFQGAHEMMGPLVFVKLPDSNYEMKIQPSQNLMWHEKVVKKTERQMVQMETNQFRV